MKETTQTEQLDEATKSGISRRRFFGMAGGVAAAGVVLGAAGCKKEEDPNGIYLGKDDFGVLNYAYALEQFQALFYTRVIETPFNGITQEEHMRITEIRDHQIAHREFFKSVLGTNAIPDITPNFYSIDFTSRDSVLAAAKLFEDLGVSAYNGAGQLFVDTNYLALAGKIVSVEARHAAYIRNLVEPGSFAGNDVIDGSGLDKSRTPAQVLAIARPYLWSNIDITGLPNN